MDLTRARESRQSQGHEPGVLPDPWPQIKLNSLGGELGSLPHRKRRPELFWFYPELFWFGFCAAINTVTKSFRVGL